MFPCNKCGACCRLVGRNPITSALDRGDGVCHYYDDSARVCSIYEDRPFICRIDEGYDALYKSQFTKDEFYQLTHNFCDLSRALLG